MNTNNNANNSDRNIDNNIYNEKKSILKRITESPEATWLTVLLGLFLLEGVLYYLAALKGDANPAFYEFSGSLMIILSLLLFLVKSKEQIAYTIKLLMLIVGLLFLALGEPLINSANLRQEYKLFCDLASFVDKEIMYNSEQSKKLAAKQYKDVPEVYAYYSAYHYANPNLRDRGDSSFQIALSEINKISDDYNGLLHEEILEYKTYLNSPATKEKYDSDVARIIEAEAAAKETVKANDTLEAKSFKAWKERKDAEKAKNNEKSNTKKSSSGTKYYYSGMLSDPDDYDSPEDFADDAWGFDFDDWDDAYDYWEDY